MALLDGQTDRRAEKGGEVGMTLRQIAERYGLTSDGVDFALSQYQIVISEITHGTMSKLSYYAKDIIQVAQERWCDTCDLKAVSGWISVKDRLPKERQDVLLKFPSNMAVGFLVKGGWMVNSGGNWTTNVLEYDEVPQYWMPLPEPPKEENDATD